MMNSVLEHVNQFVKFVQEYLQNDTFFSSKLMNRKIQVHFTFSLISVTHPKKYITCKYGMNLSTGQG